MRHDNHLLLLHLSDIHFREPICLNPDTDHDHPVRRALVNDIRKMVSKLGRVDAIVISGDIAFKSHEDEYHSASLWLDEVCAVAECPKYKIYTVPGNHDVDREIVKIQSVQDARQQLDISENIAVCDEKFYKILSDIDVGSELFKPLEQYNKFAAQFCCDISPDHPNWIEKLELSPEYTLKIHGLTTPLFSGPDNNDKSRLYLGPHQRAFSPDDGIVRLAVLHHPPDWFSDQDELDDALWNSCQIHLIGHKHKQRFMPNMKGLRLSAGAVNPSRAEGNWEPGYNFIELGVEKKENHNYLLINSHIRIWQNSPDRFIAKRTEEDEDVFFHKIRLNQPPANDKRSGSTKEPLQNDYQGESDSSDIDAVPDEDRKTSIMKEKSEQINLAERDLVVKFYELSPRQRRITMQKLDLIHPQDDQLPEPHRYRLAFERAYELGLIDKLREIVYKNLAK